MTPRDREIIDEAFEAYWDAGKLDEVFPESKGVARSAWHEAARIGYTPPEALRIAQLEAQVEAAHVIINRGVDVREWLERDTDTYPVPDERTAMQFAAISTASIQNTRATAKQRIGRDSPYWTQAYEDVCTAVEREMRERERAEAAETTRSPLRQKT